MATFSMTCSCGYTMSVDANSREDAVSMLKAGMTQQALDDHMREYHKADEPKPTLEQAHAMIDEVTTAA